MTDYIRSKRKNQSAYFAMCLKVYVKQKFLDLINLLSLDEDELVFHLGSLIYPKEVMRMYQKEQGKRKEVLKIYNYLYKFSLERL
jgi:hypothetical protein